MELIIAEKKSQASKIAEALGCKEERGHFTGTYSGKEYCIVYAAGHVLEPESPETIKNDVSWDDPQSWTPIPRDVPLRVSLDKNNKSDHAERIIKNIGYHLKRSRCVIIATDAGREGEAIGRNIVNYLEYRGTLKRAWLASGMDKESVKDAFNNLKHGNETLGLYHAAMARTMSDWAYMFLVMAYTYYASYGLLGGELGRGSNRRSRVMSVGRVQTALLMLIVQREVEIRNFVATNHFNIKVSIGLGDNNYEFQYFFTKDQIAKDGVIDGTQKIIVKQKDGQESSQLLITSEKKAQAFVEKVKSDNILTVRDVDKKLTHLDPPLPYSLSDAQQSIGTALGLSGSEVMKYLEELYLKGLVSYPRTQDNLIAMDIYTSGKYLRLIKGLSQIGEVKNECAYLTHYFNDTKTSEKHTPKCFSKKEMEHDAIIPTGYQVSKEQFDSLLGGAPNINDTKWKVYLEVAKRYLLTLFPPEQVYRKRVILEGISPEPFFDELPLFKGNFEEIKLRTWRSAFGANKESSKLPEIDAGGTINIGDCFKTASKTTAPNRFTTKGLPNEMKNVAKYESDPALRERLVSSNGIGTPATASSLVDKLLIREYIVTKKDSVYATKKGEDVVAVVPDWLKSIGLTALWEDALEKVALCKNAEQSKQMHDLFVSKQTEKVQNLISDLHKRFDGHSSTKLEQTNHPSEVSPKMKTAIRNISKSKGISLERGTLSDPTKASEFLNQHIAKNVGEDSGPSDKALEFAKAIASNMGLEPPTFDSSKHCKAFIDKNKGYAKPSVNQIDLVNKLADKLDEKNKPDPDVFKYCKECGDFISKHLGKRKIRRKSKGG